jgi:hypothetical protein
VLRRALYWLQHAQSGGEVTKWHLALLDPWLRDDEECAYMALDLLAEQWLDPVHVALLYALREMPPANGGLAPDDELLVFDATRPPITDANYVEMHNTYSTIAVCRPALSNGAWCDDDAWRGQQAHSLAVREANSRCDIQLAQVGR